MLDYMTNYATPLAFSCWEHYCIERGKAVHAYTTKRTRSSKQARHRGPKQSYWQQEKKKHTCNECRCSRGLYYHTHTYIYAPRARGHAWRTLFVKRGKDRPLSCQYRLVTFNSSELLCMGVWLAMMWKYHTTLPPVALSAFLEAFITMFLSYRFICLYCHLPNIAVL